MVRTAGGAGRQDDSKQQQLRRGQQRQGRGSGVERSVGGHLRWRRAGVLSGTPLGRHPREPQGASAQANCRTSAHGVNLKLFHVVSNGFCTKILTITLLLYKYIRSNYEGVLHLPKALYSGVLHDGAGGEAEGVSQGVR